jgi:hypothetical protein
LRQQPDLFGKLNNGQADEFQAVHWASGSIDATASAAG